MPPSSPQPLSPRSAALLATAWAPPRADPALGEKVRSSPAMLAKMANDSAGLWVILRDSAAKAIKAGDQEALEKLKESGFFPERGQKMPGFHEDWWTGAFMAGGMKGLMALLNVFTQQASETPKLSSILARAGGFGHSIARLEEAMAYLPNSGGPWREIAGLSGSMRDEFMAKAGLVLVRRGLKSGWLGQRELNAGKNPVAIRLMAYCVGALTQRVRGAVSEADFREDALALIGEIHAASRAGGEPRPTSKELDSDLLRELHQALRSGIPVNQLQPAFDLIDQQWRHKISDITAKAIARASHEEPLNLTAQTMAAALTLGASNVGAILTSGRREGVAQLADLGLLDAAPITEWRQIENPLKARWHYLEAKALAGREIDMSKRFGKITQSIEACDASEEQKKQWLSELDAFPAEPPKESRIHLPFRAEISPVALFVALTGDFEGSRGAMGDLADRGFSIKEGVEQAARWFENGKRAQKASWLPALIERQEIGLAALPAPASGRGAPRV